jgi:hypothetical protein
MKSYLRQRLVELLGFQPRTEEEEQRGVVLSDRYDKALDRYRELFKAAGGQEIPTDHLPLVALIAEAPDFKRFAQPKAKATTADPADTGGKAPDTAEKKKGGDTLNV